MDRQVSSLPGVPLRQLRAPGSPARAWGVTGLALLGLAAALSAQDPETYRLRREEMVERLLVPEGITHEGVLKSVRTVPRHLFVPPELVAQAYFDQALPIGHKQTISPPYIVAYMTQIIDPQPTDKVLEIGTGSGYQAAILSGIVKDVYTIEIVEPLGKQAAKRLKDLGYSNVHTRIGDGYAGWPEAAPFDKIIVTCSPEKVPQPLADQLREGGKMIIPLGERYQQMFYLLEKREGRLEQTRLVPTLFVPMTGTSENLREVKPNPLQPKIANGSFEEDSSGQGNPDGWHYQRQLTLLREGAPDGKICAQYQNQHPGRTAQSLQGMAIDGSKVRAVRINLWIRGADIQPGSERGELAGLVLHFYDADRKPVTQRFLGPWRGSFGWQQVSGELEVPRNAREAVIQVGLNGATGTLYVDGIKLVPRLR